MTSMSYTKVMTIAVSGKLYYVVPELGGHLIPLL